MAKDQGTNYKNITATGAVYTGATQMYAITLKGGSDASSVSIWDAVDATSGTVLWDLSAVAGGSSTVTFPEPLKVRSGVYVKTLTGTSPTVTMAMDGYFSTTSTSTSTSTTSTSTSTS